MSELILELNSERCVVNKSLTKMTKELTRYLGILSG